MPTVLTPKQERFIAEYLIDLNGKQAAIRAGYSPKSAEMQASRLLSLEKVKRAVEERSAKALKSLEITRERVLLEAARLAFSDITELYDKNGTILPTKDWP